MVYWYVLPKRVNIQNSFLLLASYLFYGYWHWSYLGLIVFSSLIDFYIGKKIYFEENFFRKKLLLLLSISINVGILITFKYYDFFIENINSTILLFGYNYKIRYLNLILPLGISFYTFQTLSYSIDVFKGKIKPTNDLISFFTYVSFFPQLIAGPIERAKDLLPQFKRIRKLDSFNVSIGLKLILWGLFKKVVIADHCAFYVDDIFQNYQDYNASTLLLGIFLFSIQIYGDFSGYSDMAVGIAKLLGFNLMYNFRMPYFAYNLSDFWNRWHISLSSWFKDYVYIPLGGNKLGEFLKWRNIFIVFLISGFWHGANWTFIAWGLFHFIAYLITSKVKFFEINRLSNVLFTFVLVSFAWVFFRSENISHAFLYINSLFDISFFAIPEIFPKTLLLFILLMLLGEYVYKFKHTLYNYIIKQKTIRFGLYYLAVYLIFYYFSSNQNFIYFQF